MAGLNTANRPLPAGWRWAKLGDVITEAASGFACGARDPKGVIQLRMNNVSTRGNLVWNDFIRVPADAETISRYQLCSGDVMFNNTNSTELVGKSALFSQHPEPVVYSNHFTRLRTDRDRLDPAYLASWLLMQWQGRTFERLCNRWIGQSAVKNDKLLALEIPLPPLPEQRRIAAILTDCIAAIDRARAAAQAQLEAAKALPAAYLRAVFDGPTMQKWPRRRLSELCELLPARSIATVGDAEVLAITTACLSESGFLVSGVKTAHMWAGNVAECKVGRGEVLIARSNTPELVGRVAVFRGEPEGAVASDLIIRVRPVRDVTSEFLAAYLSFLYLSGYWKERAGGASGSMKKITRSQIQAELIPVPVLEEQHRVAATLNTYMTSTESLHRTLEDQLGVINTLPGALLRQAFNGEL